MIPDLDWRLCFGQAYGTGASDGRPKWLISATGIFGGNQNLSWQFLRLIGRTDVSEGSNANRSLNLAIQIS